MVRNVHRRTLPCDVEATGALIDGLAGRDSIWPSGPWPALRLDGPLAVGARGGHGPIRYHCTAYEPGRVAEFTFDLPWVDGTHTFTVLPGPQLGTSVLEHVLTGDFSAPGLLLWTATIRPLHDALLEDLLDRAERRAGHEPARPARWSPWVRLVARPAMKPVRLLMR